MEEDAGTGSLEGHSQLAGRELLVAVGRHWSPCWQLAGLLGSVVEMHR